MASKPTKKAIYIGRRLYPSGKAAQVFLLLPEKKEVRYSKIQGVSIGHTYECWAKQMSRRPKRTDDERIDNPKWDAADALVDAHNAKKRAEAKVRRDSSPALKRAVEALRPLLENTSWIDRDALVQHLLHLAERKR